MIKQLRSIKYYGAALSLGMHNYYTKNEVYI